MGRRISIVFVASFILNGCFIVSKDVEKPLDFARDIVPSFDGIEIQTPEDGTEIDGMSRTLEGSCDPEMGRISLDGDILNPPVFTTCSEEGRFAVPVTFTKPYDRNGVLATQTRGEDRRESRVSYPIVFDRAPYCGDGKVNQSWERCDSEADCTAYCMSATDLASSRMKFATVTISDARSIEPATQQTIDNEAERPLENAVFLDNSTKSIPQGVPFPVTDENGVALAATFDPRTLPLARGVVISPGLSSPNSCGMVHVILHKSQSSNAWRHITMNLKFTQNGNLIPATWFLNDTATYWPMELPNDGIILPIPVGDEATLASKTYDIVYTTAGQHDAAFFGYECAAP